MITYILGPKRLCKISLYFTDQGIVVIHTFFCNFIFQKKPLVLYIHNLSDLHIFLFLGYIPPSKAEITST